MRTGRRLIEQAEHASEFVERGDTTRKCASGIWARLRIWGKGAGRSGGSLFPLFDEFLEVFGARFSYGLLAARTESTK